MAFTFPENADSPADTETAVDGEVVTDDGLPGGPQPAQDIRPAVDGEITADGGFARDEQCIQLQLAVDDEVAVHHGVAGGVQLASGVHLADDGEGAPDDRVPVGLQITLGVQPAVDDQPGRSVLRLQHTVDRQPGLDREVFRLGPTGEQVVQVRLTGRNGAPQPLRGGAVEDVQPLGRELDPPGVLLAAPHPRGVHSARGGHALEFGAAQVDGGGEEVSRLLLGGGGGCQGVGGVPLRLLAGLWRPLPAGSLPPGGGW
ncbi:MULTISPECIES: hypothetical protein [unclassified Streptomyces]|uniref:hypothetical protein n=1 Tax=unclassified Streptomyces TaxID=2593676 RepID=UPI00381B9582